MEEEKMVEEPKPSYAGVKTEENPKEEPKKELTVEEKIQQEVDDWYNDAKEEKEIWVTMTDPERNLFNSGDKAHFFISQGRSKKLPDKLTPVIQNALSSDNPLLREATDDELKKELKTLVEEKYIQAGELEAPELEEEKLKL